jgi:2-haloacid dehalogenase
VNRYLKERGSELQNTLRNEVTAMPPVRVKGIVFDMYGTLVDVGAVAEACKQVAPEAVAFTTHWRAKQLEYTFLRTLMGRYRDFWKVTEEALEFVIQHFGLQVSLEQRKQMMEAWLHPMPYPEVEASLPRLKEKYLLAILSNGTPKMLQRGLERTGLKPYFRWVMSADTVKFYKPSPEIYRLAPKQMRIRKNEILFVSSNSFDVMGSKNFGFKVCWINRARVPQDPLGLKPELLVTSLDELVEAI